MILWGVSLVQILDRGDGNLAHPSYCRHRVDESFALFREVDYIHIVIVLWRFASRALAQAQPKQAACLLGTVEAVRETGAGSLPRSYRADYDRTIATTRAQLDEEAFAATWAAR